MTHSIIVACAEHIAGQLKMARAMRDSVEVPPEHQGPPVGEEQLPTLEQYSDNLRARGGQFEQSGKTLRNAGYLGAAGLGLGSFIPKSKALRIGMRVGAGLSGFGGMLGESGMRVGRGYQLAAGELGGTPIPASELEGFTYSPSAHRAALNYGLDLTKSGSTEEPQQVGPQEPNYNQTLRDIAKRKAIVTAKEIAAISLPMAAGVGAGLGYEKFMANRGGAAPAARKLMAFGALPLVGGTVALAYRAARDLKENAFVRIREEEMAKYDQAMRDYHAQLQRNPQPEGLA